jgi:hypothetical protein
MTLFSKNFYSKYELWEAIDYDIRYQVSNYGRFRKKLKNGYRYLTPFRHHNIFQVKIKDKDFNCARLVANKFIKRLNETDRIYHKNGIGNDNYYDNLKIVSLAQLGKMTGHISKSQAVVEIKNGEISKMWKSARKCAKDLYVSYQTVMDYCNGKVKKPMFNLMWEDDYFIQEYGNSTERAELVVKMWNVEKN